MLIEPIYGPAGPSPIEARDRAALLERLRGLGIAAERVAIDSPAFGGPTAASVDVPIDRLPAIGYDIVDATNRTIGRAITQGVQFSHSNCEAVRNEARRQAFADVRAHHRARRRCRAQAGAPIAIAETSFAVFTLDQCAVQPAALAAGGPYGALLKPFDAKRCLAVDAALAVTFAIE